MAVDPLTSVYYGVIYYGVSGDERRGRLHPTPADARAEANADERPSRIVKIITDADDNVISMIYLDPESS